MSKVKRYVKKPIAVEALQLTWENLDEFREFLGTKVERLYCDVDQVELTISTLEGDMTAHTGDYIIKGVRGEFYPVRQDIFEETYEYIEGLYNEKQGKKIVGWKSPHEKEIGENIRSSTALGVSEVESKLKTFVWVNRLCEHTQTFVCAVAMDEEHAWELVKGEDENAYEQLQEGSFIKGTNSRDGIPYKPLEVKSASVWVMRSA